jgi:amidase
MELQWTDALGQAEVVRTGRASPLELVDAAIERIEKLDPAVNAVIHRRFERARDEARGELPDGSFRGVPILIKDLDAVAGEPLHYGTRFLRDAGYTAQHDAEFVRRLKRAGFVILGKTSTPEFALMITTEPLATGPTRNPWNLDRSTGGSSGGAAAAVAAGMVPVAHASDGGGSIRIPASECGLVGLKPTRARISMAPDGEGWAGASTEGAVARTVRDSAAVLDVMSGGAPGDPYPAPPLPRPLSAEVGADPGMLRIGVLAAPPFAEIPADAEVSAAVRATADLLAGLGHSVEDSYPAAMYDPDFGPHYGTITSCSVTAEIARWGELLGAPVDESRLEGMTQLSLQHGRMRTGADYVIALQWMHGFSRRVAQWWAPVDGGGAGFDLLLCPVLNGPPPPIGWFSDMATCYDRIGALLHYTAQFNITGQPGISLPLHTFADGMPLGVQLVAGYGREDVLVRVAAQLEQASPWADRRPSLG